MFSDRDHRTLPLLGCLGDGVHELQEHLERVAAKVGELLADFHARYSEPTIIYASKKNRTHRNTAFHGWAVLRGLMLMFALKTAEYPGSYVEFSDPAAWF